MESGALLSCNGYQYIIFSHAFSATKALKFQLHYPPTTRRRTSSLPISVTALAMPHNRPSQAHIVSPSKPPRKQPHPNSRSATAREAAINDIQQSSDLHSALASGLKCSVSALSASGFLSALSAICRSGAILKAPDLNIILRSFRRSKRWKDISQLFEWMQKHEKVNVASYSSYIKFMGENMNTSRALSTYESINGGAMRNNISICNSVLSCLIKSKKFEKATSLFEQMKRNGLQPDVVTYSTLLAGCMKAESGYMKASELVKELEENRILMDSVMYGTLIAVCASNGRCEEAEMYFIRMKAEGHSPNIYHYSSLLNAYSTNGNYQKADKLVQDMKAAGFMPNKVVLTTLLKVYVRGGLFEKSRLLLSELEALGYAEDEMPYCLLMDGLSKSGKVHEAKIVFDEMNQRQVRSDGYSHSIMISALCRAGLLEDARNLAGDYDAMYNKYDLVILNVMLCAYCRAGDMESVMQTMKKMDKLAINPDQYTFGILVKYFCKEKLYLLAYRTLQDMYSKGYRLEEDIQSTLIIHLGRVGAHSEAYSVYNMLRSTETAVSKTLHEKILRILLAGQLLKEAFNVVKDNAKLISPRAMKTFLTVFMESGSINSINDALKTVHTSGYKIDQNAFHQAISRYIAQPEKKELLLQLLQWIPSHGYVVGSSTRNLILKNSNLYGHHVIADILSKQHDTARTLRQYLITD